MKVDTIISKRFDELEEKIAEVEATRYSNEPSLYTWLSDEKWHEWSTNVLNLLDRALGKDSVHYVNFKSEYDRRGDATGELFNKCKGIFKAAKADFEGGYIFKMKSIVSAEIIDDFIEQAEHLLDRNYKDAACIIAGVALETTLGKICERYEMDTGRLDKMNADLAKMGVYNKGMQKQITAWADRRNNAAHGKWNEYSPEDVKDMIVGVGRFVAEYL